MDRVAMLKQVLEQNPNDAFARYGLALEYKNSGDVEGAMAEFKKLLEANPDYVPGYQMAAQTLLAADRTEEARRLFADGIACARRVNNTKALNEMEQMLAELG
jgi:tetratricopeptide (TPR) repeat protein